VLPQILPVEDAEIAGLARKQFEKQGIKIITGAKVTNSTRRPIASARPSTTARAVPRCSPSTGHLGGGRGRQYRRFWPGKAGREDRARCIVIDRFARPMCRHLRHRRCRWTADAGAQGEHEGVICVEAIKACIRIQWTSCSSRVHLLPSADRLGRPDRARAKEGGREIRVGRFRLSATAGDRASEDQGMVKVVFDKKTGQLLGRTWSVLK